MAPSMKLEERKRRIFSKSPWRRYAILGSVLSVLLLLMLVFKDPWVNPAQIWIFAGQFHPIFLHLPIGMLVIVLMMEVIAVYRGRKSHATMPLFMATLSSIAAVVFGFLLMKSSDYPAESIDSHLWSGVVFTVVLIWTFFFKMRYNEVGRGQATYWMLLITSVILMFAAGHYGGVITHGDPMDEAPWIKKAKSADLPEMDDRLVYEQIVVPILEQKCYKCHGEKKKKGHLRMDSYEAMLEGGDEGECLVPGDLEKSYMLELIHLPADDDDRMPPVGKPQLSKDELMVIEWWIQIGAPQKTKLASLDVPEDVEKAMAAMGGKKAKSGAIGKGPSKSSDGKKVDPKETNTKVRAQYQKTVKKLQKQYPGALTWLSQEDPLLVFTAVGIRADFHDSDLKNLQPLASLIYELDLTAADITDESAPVLASMKSLSLLKLPETKITDASLPAMAGLTNLQTLNLYGTVVSDDGLLKLSNLKSLKNLYLWETKVTPYGAEALQKSLPDCQINTGEKSES